MAAIAGVAQFVFGTDIWQTRGSSRAQKQGMWRSQTFPLLYPCLISLVCSFVLWGEEYDTHLLSKNLWIYKFMHHLLGLRPLYGQKVFRKRAIVIQPETPAWCRQCVKLFWGWLLLQLWVQAILRMRALVGDGNGATFLFMLCTLCKFLPYILQVSWCISNVFISCLFKAFLLDSLMNWHGTGKENKDEHHPVCKLSAPYECHICCN